MAEIGIWAAEKLVEYLIDPLVNQFKYLFCYFKNIQNLRDELETLERQQTGMKRLVDAARRNADVIDENVLAWLGNVENIKKEAQDVLNIPVNSETQCLRINPNLKFRYCQGRKATKITTRIVGLQKEGREFPAVGYPTPPQQMPINVYRDAEGIETRISKRKLIVEALNDEETYMIGICGMPGVGKTMMALEIASEVEKFFDEVVFAVVSRNPDIKKLQDQILEALDKKIHENNNERVRAGRVKERLTYDVHSKILIILDDVWEEVDLQKLGIPPKGARKGLKILLTTRFKDVCDIMGARPYVVEVLPKNEARKLFEHAARISDDTSEVVKGLASQVADECGGLPLSLVIIGKALINKEKYAWEDALQQLQNSRVTNIKGVQEHVYEIIGYSYNNLKHEDVKSLFLLCSLFPDDYSISIETLVRFARGLDMFRDTATLSEMRNRVSSVVSDLKNSYLLMPGEKENEVKLHDVVRDFCLKTASGGKHVYLAKHTALKKWPECVDDNSHTSISLTFDDEINELPSGLEYPNLKLLMLISEKVKIPNDFFSKINQVRVLQLNCSLWLSPSSMDSLKSLKTLCFDYCVLNTNISAIRSLERLEILSFFNSHISHFPIEITQLSNLKLLDLRFNNGPCPPPRVVLSSLNKLEELYLGAYFANWSGKSGDYEVEKEYVIAELSTLKGLQAFQICTHDPEFLLQMLERMFLEKLQRFQIICTDYRRREIGDYHFEKCLNLRGIEESIITQSIIHDSLLRRTDELILDRAKGSLKNFVNELDENGFVDLKKLYLFSSNVEYLIDTTQFSSKSAFNNLEELDLRNVRNLKGLCNGNVPPRVFSRLKNVSLDELPITHLWRGILKPPSLCNLTDFKMFRCHEIKSLFSESAVRCLINLEALDVSECSKLEHIFSRDAVENEVTDQVFEFKKLRYIFLLGLIELKSFRSQADGDTRTLINEVAFPNLEHLEIHYCKRLRVLFDFKGLKVTKGETQSILDRLTLLMLCNLKSLEHIVRRVPQGIRVFTNLTSLQVRGCSSLGYLFSPSVSSWLSGLETLVVGRCDAIENIVGREQEEMVEPTFIYKLVFPKLSTLKLIKLPSLKMFCSKNIEFVFPSLHKLVIAACPVMEKFSSQEPDAPKLKKMEIGDGSFVDFSNILDPGVNNVQGENVKQLYEN